MTKKRRYSREEEYNKFEKENPEFGWEGKTGVIILPPAEQEDEEDGKL